MFPLCLVAIVAAIAGFIAVGLALGTGAGMMLLAAAPALGATSLVSGTAAAVIALRRYG